MLHSAPMVELVMMTRLSTDGGASGQFAVLSTDGGAGSVEMFALLGTRGEATWRLKSLYSTK